jgi:ribonuclease P protein component
MENHRFPKALRLLVPRDFERVYAERQSARDSWVMMHAVSNQLDHPRLGLAVSRRAGGAVARNRWKRLLREAFRLAQHRLPAMDMVVSPRASEPPPLHQLLESLPALAHRVQLSEIRRRAGERASGSQSERSAADRDL